VLLELLRRDKVSAAYLAEKFEVSQRTVYRYVDVLSGNGIPVFCERGRNGGIRLADNCRLHSAYLTDDEKADIFSALNLLEAATPSEKIDHIRAKLNALNSAKRDDTFIVGNDRLIVDGGILNNEAQYKDKIEPLKKALDGCLTVKLVYHDRGGEISNARLNRWLLF
jgi:Predicted transcriptional regulator